MFRAIICTGSKKGKNSASEIVVSGIYLGGRQRAIQDIFRNLGHLISKLSYVQMRINIEEFVNHLYCIGLVASTGVR